MEVQTLPVLTGKDFYKRWKCQPRSTKTHTDINNENLIIDHIVYYVKFRNRESRLSRMLCNLYIYLILRVIKKFNFSLPRDILTPPRREFTAPNKLGGLGCLFCRCSRDCIFVFLGFTSSLEKEFVINSDACVEIGKNYSLIGHSNATVLLPLRHCQKSSSHRLISSRDI